MQNGGDDEARRNGREGEEVEGKQEGTELNPKPFNKLRYKIAKLNSDEYEENEATASSAVQEESPKTPDSPLSLDESSSNFLSGFFDKWRALRKMKKFQTRPRTTAEEVVDVPKIPSPPRAPPVGPKGGINFGPFSPIGSNRQSSDSKKSTINFRVKSPVGPRSVCKRKPVKRPLGLGLLAPHQTTYLRDRPPQLPPVYASDPDPNTPMGPPESKIIRTPYETVKKALTFLKSELGLTTYTSSPQAAAYAAKNGWELEIVPLPRLPSYSLSKISPNMGLSVEEVIMELEEYLSSMPETTSSTAMKSNLMKFQMKLGMPPWPAIYNLMWQSAMAFLKHLAKYFPHDSWDDTF